MSSDTAPTLSSQSLKIEWAGPDDLFIEACWRDILDAFNYTLPPRDPIEVSFTSRASFFWHGHSCCGTRLRATRERSS